MLVEKGVLGLAVGKPHEGKSRGAVADIGEGGTDATLCQGLAQHRPEEIGRQAAEEAGIGAQPADAKVLRPPANVDTTSSIAKLAEPAAAPVKVAENRAEPVAASVARKSDAVPARIQAPEPAPAMSHQAAVVASGKWVIQLGATDDEAKAKEILARARTKAAGPLAAITAGAFAEWRFGG